MTSTLIQQLSDDHSGLSPLASDWARDLFEVDPTVEEIWNSSGYEEATAYFDAIEREHAEETRSAPVITVNSRTETTSPEQVVPQPPRLVRSTVTGAPSVGQTDLAGPASQRGQQWEAYIATLSLVGLEKLICDLQGDIKAGEFGGEQAQALRDLKKITTIYEVRMHAPNVYVPHVPTAVLELNSQRIDVVARPHYDQAGHTTSLHKTAIAHRHDQERLDSTTAHIAERIEGLNLRALQYLPELLVQLPEGGGTREIAHAQEYLEENAISDPRDLLAKGWVMPGTERELQYAAIGRDPGGHGLDILF
jgi:hypothetical protein